ncbi:bifunctional diaminohydroxyphosphoribosylaminopyrimidine deaminase/5-amino-6-(5-phosphoribosylamino)uracil reductase RibD [Galbibacter sp.]|jgi:diaminohydroxyphosphoribosylaminopyrimidine deaminase/5-amino-6-(5-phosphoribosylamino)uracil reductase|uniref:bifunctional diaminohydroxyphosphoribosylaminopyrimidine deaminase/5-amino-6-(5-phosphoribosylamino)uracil reductase RibD n=1 Tax=Galbibacter sp. TaxID=2918471 RepID=UPI003A93D095
MKIHEIYIKRAIQLAKNGLGNTYPNPMVGCVIVANNKIIGEGFTSPAGQNHAEVNAIESVKDKSLLKVATLYVTLEPCSHYGKTPPCADLIVNSKIPTVVIGTMDTNVEVSGRGVQKLSAAGIDVILGTLEEQCVALNKRFFSVQEKKRPFIILKWAQTSDLYISPDKTQGEPAPFWITNVYSRQLVHKWRTEEQAILVGTQTVISDNPKLSARDWKGNHPIRIVLDANLRTPRQLHLWDDSIPTIFITSANQVSPKELYTQTSFEPIDFSKHIAEQIITILYKHKIQSVLIEGGTKTLQTFINSGLWDEARVFTSIENLGKGTKAPVLQNYKSSLQFKLNQDTVNYYEPLAREDTL